MKQHKIYEPTDKMILLISDNYNVLQTMEAFGISMGFGDKTVDEVCAERNVDTFTFRAVVNFTINGYHEVYDIEKLSVPTLLHYLKASHRFFLHFQLPYIRESLIGALDTENNLAKLIIKLYDGYAKEIKAHMNYEEKNVFPYVEALLRGEEPTDYDIETYSKHHRKTLQLHELKNIIIKYLPDDEKRSNLLSTTLYNIYNNEEWLLLHEKVEENIFIPVIRNMEQKQKKDDLSLKISNMISQNDKNVDVLSEREKEVIVGVVQGMLNKEIADWLHISTNTVITHRRNIARKLQIHSPAGLTIYAIVNNMIDISKVSI